MLGFTGYTTFLSILATAYAQQKSTFVTETHPQLSWQNCTSPTSCTTQQGYVTLDANWRWLHSVASTNSCYAGNEWNSQYCPDPMSCARNCGLDGVDYPNTYGIKTQGNAINLAFKTGSNIGSRVYLMDSTDTNYQLFNLLNQEFTFDVNPSSIPCGINSALYFTDMYADGGSSRYSSNRAGARYGTGYCDAQCPHDIKFINGQANINNWTATTANSGVGQWGSCCAEMDIWQANSFSTAVTPHPCSYTGQVLCGSVPGTDCSGVCDPTGCDFNPYRLGNTDFYGPGDTVNSNKKFTVVTQFITDDGTSYGNLIEIRRFYVQNGVVIPNSQSTIPGLSGDSITNDFCLTEKAAFGEVNTFAQQGGLAQLGEAFMGGMVLVLSIWDDYENNMLWLDSDFPTDADPSQPGIVRGPCPTTSGNASAIESSAAGATASVIFSNIKVGPINGTFDFTATSTTSTTTTTTQASSPTQSKYGQCGGNEYTGPTICVDGTTCTAIYPPYYSQCL